MANTVWVKVLKTYCGEHGIFPIGHTMPVAEAAVAELGGEYFAPCPPPWEQHLDKSVVERERLQKQIAALEAESVRAGETYAALLADVEELGKPLGDMAAAVAEAEVAAKAALKKAQGPKHTPADVAAAHAAKLAYEQLDHEHARREAQMHLALAEAGLEQVRGERCDLDIAAMKAKLAKLQPPKPKPKPGKE